MILEKIDYTRLNYCLNNEPQERGTGVTFADCYRAVMKVVGAPDDVLSVILMVPGGRWAEHVNDYILKISSFLGIKVQPMSLTEIRFPEMNKRITIETLVRMEQKVRGVNPNSYIAIRMRGGS